MKYAIISDIHGNLPALNAVLEDARNHDVEAYMLVGDYYCDLPYPNEVVDTIRNLENAYIIKGNKEGYLNNLAKTDQSEWVLEQFAPLYWNYRELRPDNLDYLMALPEEVVISAPDNYNQIHVSHACPDLSRCNGIRLLSSSQYRKKMELEAFTHEDYLQYTHDLLCQDDRVIDILNNIAPNIIVFGHSHIQWHVTIDGKLLINPGSCGLPLDYNTTAAYTILETNGNATQVIERRIPYDIQSTLQDAQHSTLYEASSIWCNIIFKQLLSAADEIIVFFQHVESVAKTCKDDHRPYSNTVWKQASESWNFE